MHRSALIERAGVTLVELMVALAMLSIGVLGVIGSYRYINLGIQSAKIRSLANNIAQERIEFIKNKSYYKVLVTTAPFPGGDTNFDPPMEYDQAPNGYETVNVGGIDFIRRVYICKVNEGSGGELGNCLSWDNADTGIKQVRVMVVWQERGEWRKLELRNLIYNPARTNQSATISGTATENVAGNPAISDVVVRAEESPSNYGATNASGEYSFTVEPGSYSLLATKQGFFPKTLPYGPTGSGKNFSLTRMSSGSVTGQVFKRDHLVIHAVAGSTVMVNGDDVEFVALYNPTTAPINIGDASGNLVKLSYYGENGAGQDVNMFALSYVSTWVPSGYYYVIANTGSFQFAGYNITADAVYSDTNQPPCSPVDNDMLDCIRIDKAGAVRIWSESNQVLDTLGWNNSASGKTAQVYETHPYYWNWFAPQQVGLERGAYFFRFTCSWSVWWKDGSAYDTDDNLYNFYYLPASAGWSYPMISRADGYRHPVCGTPAAGAIVFANDGLSSSAQAGTEGDFSLVSVATGTAWQLFASSGVLYSSFTFIPAAHGLSTSMGRLHISSVTSYGYVTGRVTDVNNVPLAGIKMYSPGVPQINTGSDGRYVLPVVAGAVTVTANFQSQNQTYVELSSAGIQMDIGSVQSNVNFQLYQGGRIRGRITSNGADALPNIPVVATKNGVEQGSAVSDANGYFTISGYGISTGTYLVAPQLEAGESATPSVTGATVTAGGTIFTTTFTVTGTPGYFTGSVRTGSATGPVINTGVMLYITTATISSDPPSIDSTLRAGNSLYFAGSAGATGQYSIAVKGGFTYNIYAWYTTWSGSTPATVRKSSTTVPISPSQTKTVNFFW